MTSDLSTSAAIPRNRLGEEGVHFDPVLASEVLDGLSRAQKTLSSAWFYDDEGSRLFSEITRQPEYYLTRVESEILSTRGRELADLIVPDRRPIDLIELGSGDGEKTLVLCQSLVAGGHDCVYHPIDLSRLAVQRLRERFALHMPELPVRPLVGDYFSDWPRRTPGSRQVAMLMGSNLGNLTEPEALGLLRRIRGQLASGDILVLGLDLKKDPHVILAAYDDAAGVTARFNLNLLARLNRELEMDFALREFSHYASYSPLDGAARSFLVSRRRQLVRSRLLAREFRFAEGETIYTERSQKYCKSTIERLAAASGFEARACLNDVREWYTVVVWQAAVGPRPRAN